MSSCAKFQNDSSFKSIVFTKKRKKNVFVVRATLIIFLKYYFSAKWSTMVPTFVLCFMVVGRVVYEKKNHKETIDVDALELCSFCLVNYVLKNFPTRKFVQKIFFYSKKFEIHLLKYEIENGFLFIKYATDSQASYFKNFID